MTIIDQDSIEKAITLAQPTIESILEDPKSTWGPKYVEVFVAMEDDCNEYSTTIGEEEPWNPSWGEELESDFSWIAEKKAEASLRAKMSTSVMVDKFPWTFEEGEFLYAGGVYYGGIAVGVSGVHEKVDEAIATIILNMIIMLARQETKQKIEKGDYKM